MGDLRSPAALGAARARLAHNLREARLRSGLSQEALSARTRLHRTEISLLERGERDPRISTVMRLAHAMGVPTCELFEGIE